MRQARWAAWAGVVLALTAGCASGPPLDNPLAVLPGPAAAAEHNPVYVPLGPNSYPLVYENAIQVLVDQGFEILDANRYDGHIETVPRIAPGLGLFFRPGSPDCYERLLANIQTYRHRVLLKIDPAPNGGYFIAVTVFKELEDLPRPVRATAGASIFGYTPTVERQFEVIDPTVYEAGWIPRGRDTALEQAILQRLKACM